MPWWSTAQQQHQDKLVLYRLRGYPPWPGMVLRLKSRAYLQSPMNDLAPPEDALFDRVQTCIQRGKGIKKGDTVTAYVADESDSDSSAGSDSESSSARSSLLPGRKEKAKVLEVRGRKLKVEYKRTGKTAVIPKSWAELLSKKILQTQKAGMVKRATGKVREIALRGKQRGVVPSGFVIVYSFGDEMYRKVRASSLIPYDPSTLPGLLHRRKLLTQCLEEVKMRGFSGTRALREIRKEWKRRQKLQEEQADAQRYREHHGLERPAAPSPAPPVTASSWKRPSPGGIPQPVYSQCATPPPRRIATPVANTVARSMGAPQCSVPVRLQGHMVTFYEQVEGTGEQSVPTTSELEEARNAFGLEEGYTLADLNRSRRLLALKRHPDKALPANKEWAHKDWLRLDAAYTKLKRCL